MESKPQENQPDTRPVPVYVLPCTDQDDEISLIDLWRVIASRRKLILISVLAALVLASVYLFLAEPLYRAEAHLLPPQQQDIQELMIDSKNTGAATPDRIYVFMLSENESTYIPLGTTHRLENPGNIPLEIIEVQSGSYLGEDDIVRFEDVYNRVE